MAHILVLGAGYGGLRAARDLAKNTPAGTQIDLIDNVVSLETFAKDIGSLLAEPDYGFTVNIINYNGIQLNDAVLVNLTETNKKVYEVKNIHYRYNGGTSEATLDLKPVLISVNNNQKSTPSTIHNGK